MSKLFQAHLIREIILFALLAISMSFFFSWTLYSHLTEEFINQGRAISKSIANSSVETLLNRDISTVQASIDQFLDGQSGVAYLFVVDEMSQIVAHTFVPSIPVQIFDITEGEPDQITIRDITLSDRGNFINITSPVLAGVAGYVHVGMDKGVIEAKIESVIIKQTVLIALIFVISIMAAYIQANQISHPLIKLAEFAREVTENSISGKRMASKSKELLSVARMDEVGQLTQDFQRMVQVVFEREKDLEEHSRELANANQKITALNQQLEEENVRLGAELDVTRQLQQMLLPSKDELQQIKGLDIASFMKPADEVGGDYYDILQHNGHVKIGIGDVTGHGLESGVLMLMTQTAVRTLLTNNETNPTRFLNTLNRTIYDNVQRMQANKSLSLSLLDYQSNGHIRLSGQHEELIIVRRDRRIELIDTMNLGFPIGLDDDITNFVNEAFIKLQPGDGVVLYTDGITEAENIAGEQYGLERMCAVLRDHWPEPAEFIKETLIEDIHKYIGKQKVYDDITLLILKQQ